MTTSPGLVTRVFQTYSEAFSEPGEARYWELLQQLPVISALRTLASINSILAGSAANQEIQAKLLERFVDPGIRSELSSADSDDGAPPLLFQRLGNLAAIHNLILYGADTSSDLVVERYLIGELVLCANDHIQLGPPVGPTTNLGIAAMFAGAWDAHNPSAPRDALPRAWIIFREILEGHDHEIATLRCSLDAPLTIDGLTLPEFLASVFCTLLPAHDDPGSPEAVILDLQRFEKELPVARKLLWRFMADRALPLDQLREQLPGSGQAGRGQFLDGLTATMAISALNVFRRFPFVALGGERYLVLDYQLLHESLNSGAYWTTFNGLSEADRDTFCKLWGRAFELYVRDLLRSFYPPVSGIMSEAVVYSEGEIDALLDFGDEVVVLEIKSSKLKLAAKSGAGTEAFRKEVELKFVRNEKGKAKAVEQLSKSCSFITVANNGITVKSPLCIYPVIVADEPACESLGFNAYLNERFQDESSDDRRIMPLTVMSVEDCEEALPHISRGDFSWSHLLQKRFEGEGVALTSVSQAIYDLRQERCLERQVNDYLVARFDQSDKEIWDALGGRQSRES